MATPTTSTPETGTETRTSTASIRRWEHMNGREIASLDRARTVVLVSCSPLEVHGPHLPTITDNLEGHAIMLSAAEHLALAHPEIDFVTLPGIYVAADVLPHAGSIQFRSTTVERVLEDLGRSLAKQGFRHLWVSNFHGGPRHFVPIEAACDRVSRRHGISMVSLFSMLIGRLTGGVSDLSEVFAHIEGIDKATLVNDSHGGAIETSLLLHLLGEHVAPDYAELPRRTVDIVLGERGERPLAGPGEKVPWREHLRAFKHKLGYYYTETYCGSPAAATPELGARFLDELGRRAAGPLGELWRGEIAATECHSPLWKMRWAFTIPAVGWAFERVMGFRSRVF